VGANVDLRGDGGGGTVVIEATGDLAVNAPLLVSGTGTASCGGRATIGQAGTATVTLSDNPIDASGESCGGRVIVNADSMATATGEVNADTAGDPGTGGLISLTAATVSVNGTLHANGGGEVALQACNLTLEPAGQVLATGAGGFTLLQASGPMKVDGTLTAGSSNTLDFLDPAHLPVVNSTSVSPDADVVLNEPPVLPLCPGQTTTTTTSSTTVTTSTTTAPASTTTSTTEPGTTSTTSSTTVPTTTTTSTTLETCARPATTVARAGREHASMGPVSTFR